MRIEYLKLTIYIYLHVRDRIKKTIVDMMLGIWTEKRMEFRSFFSENQCFRSRCGHIQYKSWPRTRLFLKSHLDKSNIVVMNNWHMIQSNDCWTNGPYIVHIIHERFPMNYITKRKFELEICAVELSQKI